VGKCVLGVMIGGVGVDNKLERKVRLYTMHRYGEEGKKWGVAGEVLYALHRLKICVS
jgi:hypothetical protein